jgi:glycosyltransferase involved in cell wall biosynthesis
MIVQNEADYLERCLSSAANIVSEVIVVDTGSTDKSQEIAKRFGASVITVPWEDDFAKARNEGLKQATKKWILVLDADEELEEPDDEYLNHLMQQEDVYGYFVKMKNYVGTLSTGEYVIDSVCRLFRNHPAIRFTSSIHEEVPPAILTIPDARIEFSEITVRHYGYLDEVIHRKKKNVRNLKIIQGALKRNPHDLRLQYALGTEYFQREKYAEALVIFESVLPRVPVFSGYDSDLLLKTAYALRETGRKQEAVHVIDEALLFYPDFSDLLELKAMMLMDREQYQDAYSIFLQAIQTGNASYKYTSSSGSGTYRSHYLAGLTCEYLYLWSEAKTHYMQALSHHPGYLPVWGRLPNIAFLLGDTEELLNYLAEHRNRIPEIVWNLMLQTAVNGRNPDFAMRILTCQDIVKPSDPMLEAVLLTQQNQENRAEAVCQSSRTALRHLVLWALAVKASDSHSAMKQFEHLSILDSSFSSIEEILKEDNKMGNISEQTLRKCQEALLQVGAWDGFLRLQSQIPAGFAGARLPIHMLYGLQQAPPAVKWQLVSICKTRQDKLTYPEMLAAGMFACDCGEYDEAYDWFSKTHAQFPNRIAPFVGLLHVFVAKARSFSGQPIDSAASDLRFLTLCE